LDQLRHRLFKVLEEQPPNHVDMHNSLLDWGAVGHVDLERICAFDSDTVVLLDCCRAGSDESLYLSSLFAVIKVSDEIPFLAILDAVILDYVSTSVTTYCLC
jgi:hypothetical protein